MGVVVHGYSETGLVAATIDGVRMDVPDDMGNRHRRRIAEEWEALGNTIPPYVPVATLPPPISRRQMLLGLLSIGITSDQVVAEIQAIADPMERAAAMIEWEAAGQIERDHPLVAYLAVHFSLPAEQVDALWLWAAGL